MLSLLPDDGIRDTFCVHGIVTCSIIKQAVKQSWTIHIHQLVGQDGHEIREDVVLHPRERELLALMLINSLPADRLAFKVYLPLTSLSPYPSIGLQHHSTCLCFGMNNTKLPVVYRMLTIITRSLNSRVRLYARLFKD